MAGSAISCPLFKYFKLQRRKVPRMLIFNGFLIQVGVAVDVCGSKGAA